MITVMMASATVSPRLPTVLRTHRLLPVGRIALRQYGVARPHSPPRCLHPTLGQGRDYRSILETAASAIQPGEPTGHAGWRSGGQNLTAVPDDRGRPNVVVHHSLPGWRPGAASRASTTRAEVQAAPAK